MKAGHCRCSKAAAGKLLLLAAPILLAAGLSGSDADRCLVPPTVREAILNEFSGEEALRHVEILSVDRNRQAEEYLERFMETEYMTKLARQYGLSDVREDFFPSGDIWDAEEADLWILEPVKKKIASLELIPEALASGSKSADVEAELVFVGSGRDADFEGKDVAGKILLTSGSPGSVFGAGVTKRGAAGVMGTGSPGANADAPGYSIDQIGWQSVNPGEGAGFGFTLSKRQFDELRGYLDRGRTVRMRAHVRTRTYPYKMNVVSAAIPGTDAGVGELLYVAHLFERIGTPGANDNCSGVATALEIGRVLARLIRQGVLPQPKRTIRFLWVPEISGSREFMHKYPDLEDKLLAVLNFDMSGADMEATDTYVRMKMTPDSVPSFINDLMGNILQFVDQTEIRSQWGTGSQFNYRMCPFISGSDHIVFLPAGIPAMQFNHWPDNFYHSSEDRSRYVDPTQLKRIGFAAAAAFYYLSTAGSEEARDLAWECSANGAKWLAEVTRQSTRLLGDQPGAIHERHKAAAWKIDGAFGRGKGSVESVLRISDAPEVASLVGTLVGGIGKAREIHKGILETQYRDRCRAVGVEPQAIALTAEEQQYSRWIPRRIYKTFTEEHRTRSQKISGALPKEGPRLSGLASFEVPIFIDGSRSVLAIYQAVRAEHGHVDTGSSEHKFAYVVKPEAADIPLQAVVDYIQALEKVGLVEIQRR
ncbi:MAG: M28 family peptidase [Acidobacteria bacterium]|nr:M28 family peptidase [Acidobacteriota bacterium]